MVGAGVIGLTSAVRLAEAGYQVDVLARELPLETTSAAAAGLWMPYLAEPAESVGRWARLTLDTLVELAGSGVKTGVTIRAGYLLGAGPDRPAWTVGLSTRLELAPVANPAPGHSGGWHLRVPVVDMSVYLPYLARRLLAADGTLTRLPLTALPARGVVVNCTGLASRALAADPGLYPIRGQVLWTTNPGLTSWWSEEATGDQAEGDQAGGDQAGGDSRLTYVIPHENHVVVGGTVEPGNWSTTPDRRTGTRILERAGALVPALRSATVLSHRVGLRPGRPGIRLETVPEPEGTLIHCYGHGGSGVTLSWGCADDVLAEVTHVVACQA